MSVDHKVAVHKSVLNWPKHVKKIIKKAALYAPVGDPKTVALQANPSVFNKWSWQRLLGLETVSIGLQPVFSCKKSSSIGSNVLAQMS